MTYFKQVSLMLLIISSLMISCEEDSLPEIQLPLAGTYILSAMTISVEARTLRDTTVHFTVSQNGIDSIQIAAGTLVENSSTHYSDQDAIPIGGNVILNNDGSSRLEGYLPVNVGSGCQPIITILNLNSDGLWAADTTTGTFALDLVVDALDIDGTFTMEGNQMDVRYTLAEELDERTVYTVSFGGSDTAIEPSCIPVSTLTERILLLTLN